MVTSTETPAVKAKWLQVRSSMQANMSSVLLPGVVKMRRGQVATFMLQVNTMQEVYQIFHLFATTILSKYSFQLQRCSARYMWS